MASVAYSGFVIPGTGALWLDKPHWFNYRTVIESIKGFLAVNPLPEGKRYCIVMDNAPWHRKAIRLIEENMDGEYDDILDMADFIRLPPYSPDLNPIEQVWRVTRKERTHNRYFQSLESLTSILDEFFGGLRGPNAKLKSLCSFNWLTNRYHSSTPTDFRRLL